MSIPTATYRIQFRNGMTFDRAASLVPYLKQLGISHLYASPIFTATSDSTHGYDVTDASEIEPSIGGRAGFDRLVSALKNAGLGLILDIVPNHMAASLENAWWRDVIEYGEKSRYARHFDIDWSRRLTLPFLGDPFETALENGEIRIVADPASGRPALAYYDNLYPLDPASWQDREAEILALTDPDPIAELHQQQPWRLMCWRDAASELSYRRFFEITGLVGVRVEDDRVFDDTHRLILELVHSGAVDGLRVDHVDGLADPQAYLTRLRQQAGPECYITVEKILGKDEQLPPDWPVSGTTGYEFMAALSDALVDGSKISMLRNLYNKVVNKPVNMVAELRAAKLLMADKNFAGEFTTLLNLARDIAGQAGLIQDEDRLRQALRELLVAFPVYRTYGTETGLPEADRERLQTVANSVKNSVNAPDPAALDVLLRILTGEVPQASRQQANAFRIRFQQLTGPLMAKSVEDTLFFRQHMSLALNEVGAEPLPRAFSLERFHREMLIRLEQQPDALSGTTTHDTKRGEDARARLYTLSEAPDHWAECVARWCQMNHAWVVTLDDGPAPKPSVEWMLYQALAGVWPATLQPGDSAGLAALEARFRTYVQKALREAKQRTNWTAVNDDYENAVLDYASHLLSPANRPFLQDFTASLTPFIQAGLVNSLTQTVVKLTAPGVPDIYQGSETLDFSLIDPDNRREPDFAALEKMLTARRIPLDTAQPHWLNGQLNQHVIATLLHRRLTTPLLFRRGEYLPLTAHGPLEDNVIAFARRDNTDALVVIAPRLLLNLPGSHRDPTERETVLMLPAPLARRRYRNVLSGEVMFLTDRLSLAAHAALPLILASE